jgi:hypothetical protein
MRGMFITQSRAMDPSLRGWTPHIPTAPRLNSYLDIFNDADIVAQRATQMPPTAELSINVSAPLLYHFGPPAEGWDMGLQGGIEMRGLGACAPGDEFCDSGTQQPKLATRMLTTTTVQAPRLSLTTQQMPTLTLSKPATTSSLTVTPPPAPEQYYAAAPPAQSDPVQEPIMLPLPPPAAASGSTSFPWWVLALVGAGYFAMQR